mgnify:CR=1 FL=1
MLVLSRRPGDAILIDFALQMNVWRMITVAGKRAGDKRLECVVCYAESDDGRAWRRDGSVAVGFGSQTAYLLTVAGDTIECCDGEFNSVASTSKPVKFVGIPFGNFSG